MSAEGWTVRGPDGNGGTIDYEVSSPHLYYVDGEWQRGSFMLRPVPAPSEPEQCDGSGWLLGPLHHPPEWEDHQRCPGCPACTPCATCGKVGGGGWVKARGSDPDIVSKRPCPSCGEGTT